jgi:sulfite exporter TauE/SafE
LSASFAKSGDKIIPQTLFHFGRLISFFVLGGVIGAVGSFFRLNQWSTFIISFLVALILIMMGLNLLDVFPRLGRFQISFPKQWAKSISTLNQWGKYGAPLLAGAITFFLPCGFTQSMQMYTLTTGSFWQGALTMFSFALGTLPVLALLSFGFAGLKKASLGIVFKSAGLVVIFFGVLNLINSLAAAGLIAPLLNF